MKTMLVQTAKIGLVVSSVALGLSGCPSSPKELGPIATKDSSIPARRLQQIRTAFPTARMDASTGGVAKIYGPSLATGATAAEAAEKFKTVYASTVGVQAGELVFQSSLQGNGFPSSSPSGIGLMYDEATKRPKFWLYTSAQNKAGVPVYRAGLSILVRNDTTHAVVWASSTVRDLSAFMLPATLNARAPDWNKSLLAIPTSTSYDGRIHAAPQAISKVSESELIVFTGTEDKEEAPRMAIQYTVETLPSGRWQFVADATTGDVIHLENLISSFDVTGKVEGRGTQGDVAMECAPAVAKGLRYAEVDGPSSEQAFADGNGNYLLSTAATSAITIKSLMGGQNFDVFNVAGPGEELSNSVTPPGQADFLHNAANTDQEVLAQVNGYTSADELRDFVLSYLPTYPTIATQTHFPVNVNLSHSDWDHCPGDGYYDGVSLNLCKGGDKDGWTYTNTAFASVIHHEYGHHLIAVSPNSGQGEYGEGMADTVAALFAGQHGMSYGFFVGYCDYAPRDALNNCQYDATICSSCASSPPAPQPGEIHFCGLLMSGTVWDIRIALSVTHPSTFVDIINRLTLNSILVHVGSGINAQIAIDMLTLDDDDGDINNGTPHRAEICSGFAKHGMLCPSLSGNLAPVVNAGPDQTINLPAVASLAGSATDDGLPNPPNGVTVVGWSLINGPAGGTVSFGTAMSWNTTASFSMPGSYVFRLIVTDGSDLGQDDVIVAVNPVNNPPVVEAGANQTITLPASASLSGTATDDGQPPPSTLTYAWSLASGPVGGTVSWSAPTSLTTTASFSLPGTYVLKLTVSDGLASGDDTVVITVNPANTAPIVEAGPNQTIYVTGAANLVGSVTDDGLPLPSKLTMVWSKVNGPGNVAFGTPDSLTTTATFTQVGTYVLKLSVSDGLLTGVDTVTIVVNPATPCSGLCNNPTSITLPPNYQGTNIGSGEICLQTYSKLSGGNCGNFVSPRATTVNGSTISCSLPNGQNSGNWASIPGKRNGGYCIHVTAGQKDWAYLTLW